MWIDEILNSADSPKSGVPTLPPAVIQERFVGRSGKAALLEVVPFVKIIDGLVNLTNHPTALDLGVGWGRIARFFQKTISPESFWLADVDPEALEISQQCGVKGSFILLKPDGALPIADSTIDVAYSYSVFSHLSEDAAIHWLRELVRVLKTKSSLVFTTPSMRFLQLVNACHNKTNPTDMERNLGLYMGENPQLAIERYANGEHAYSGTGGGGVLSGDFYGWAAIPPAWIESNFGDMLSIEDYIDDPAQFEQAVYTVKKR